MERKRGRKKRFADDVLVKAMEHANLLYHMSKLAVSAVARNMGASPGTVEPLLFPTVAAWERWEEAGKPCLLPSRFLADERAAKPQEEWSA